MNNVLAGIGARDRRWAAGSAGLSGRTNKEHTHILW